MHACYVCLLALITTFAKQLLSYVCMQTMFAYFMYSLDWISVLCDDYSKFPSLHLDTWICTLEHLDTWAKSLS